MARKRLPGRPKLPKGQRQASVITVRMSRAERAKIQRGAKASGQKLSAWTRSVLLTAADAITIKKEEAEGEGIEPPSLSHQRVLGM